jgi:hypothetical protein
MHKQIVHMSQTVQVPTDWFSFTNTNADPKIGVGVCVGRTVS